MDKTKGKSEADAEKQAEEEAEEEVDEVADGEVESEVRGEGEAKGKAKERQNKSQKRRLSTTKSSNPGPGQSYQIRRCTREYLKESHSDRGRRTNLLSHWCEGKNRRSCFALE